MSNDTDFRLKFICSSQSELERVMQYLQLKKRRWESWKSLGLGSQELLDRVGGSKPAAVVSWGFDFEDVVVDDDGIAFVKATTWANQNWGNVHVDGEEGELAELILRFPSLVVLGKYKSESAEEEYGDSWITLDAFRGASTDFSYGEVEEDEDDDQE